MFSVLPLSSHAKAAFPSLDHSIARPLRRLYRRQATPHSSFQILDASSLTVTTMGTKR